jgi:hypothetical protein
MAQWFVLGKRERDDFFNHRGRESTEEEIKKLSIFFLFLCALCGKKSFFLIYL